MEAPGQGIPAAPLTENQLAGVIACFLLDHYPILLERCEIFGIYGQIWLKEMRKCGS